MSHLEPSVVMQQAVKVTGTLEQRERPAIEIDRTRWRQEQNMFCSLETGQLLGKLYF